MSLHYSAGKLLLQNASDLNWYYLEVRIDDSDLLPHLYPHQDEAGDFSLSDYDTYAVIRASNGDLYKLDLYTNEEDVVTYRLELYETITQLPVRVFIKDTATGLLYQLTLTENDLGVYPQLNAAGGLVSVGNTVNRPFLCATPATTLEGICKTAANFLTKATVLVPTQVPLPTGGFLLGSGGEGLLDTEGDRIRESSE